jgi:hypothetical protein
MSDFFDFLEGKKTYLTAIVTAIIAGVQALGVEIPQWIYAILGALGLGALRAAVTRQRER